MEPKGARGRICSQINLEPQSSYYQRAKGPSEKEYFEMALHTCWGTVPGTGRQSRRKGHRLFLKKSLDDGGADQKS